MILSKKIKIFVNASNKKRLDNLGYKDLLINTEIEIDIEHLTKGSHVLIDAQCNICNSTNKVVYKNYIKITNDKTHKYFCKKCAKYKTKETNIKTWGTECSLNNESIKVKTSKTLKEKWGVDFISKSPIVKEKVKYTNLKKYRVEYYLQSEEKKIKYEKYISNRNFNKYKLIIDNTLYTLLDTSNKKFKILHNICNNIFEINRASLYDRLNNNRCLCTKCFPILENQSISEREISKWLLNLGINIIESDKSVLNPKHLDVYIPSHNLGIEMNGLYWHSEIKKPINYHLDKSLKCQEKGVQLLHIWEDEWIFKQDIIKSIILNKLGLIKEKIYARNCDIRVVEDSKLIRQFLDTNHIQGYCNSSIKLGLYKNDELISLMIFGKRMINKKIEFELLRFCNKINLNVIGSASKLFNYFKNNYHFTDLISYSDFRLFDGKMYETLGFTKSHLSKPDYFWCKNLERYHRSNFMKHKLVKEGFDKNKTENEIMWERGYYRVFGCGQYKWMYKKIISFGY